MRPIHLIKMFNLIIINMVIIHPQHIDMAVVMEQE
jgi:hypothetical protein